MCPKLSEHFISPHFFLPSVLSIHLSVYMCVINPVCVFGGCSTSSSLLHPARSLTRDLTTSAATSQTFHCCVSTINSRWAREKDWGMPNQLAEAATVTQARCQKLSRHTQSCAKLSLEPLAKATQKHFPFDCTRCADVERKPIALRFADTQQGLQWPGLN